jgi:hypothetical protein
MEVIMIIRGTEVARQEVSDFLLQDDPQQSAETNYLSRQKIIGWNIQDMKIKYHRVIKGKDVQFWLSFESAMNNMEDAHLDLISKMADTDLIM